MARVRLNAIAASTSRAKLAAKLPEGRCLRGRFQVSDDLFDDGVPAVVGLGVQHRTGSIGEHGVVPPGREQFTLRVFDVVVGVRVEGADALLLDTEDARGLGRAIAPLARARGASVLEVRAVDEDLEDVFRYLVER